MGRAPGTDPMTSRALRREGLGAEQFPHDVAELQRLLGPLDRSRSVNAIPGAGTEVPIWLLGSSLYSAQLAAQLAVRGRRVPLVLRALRRSLSENNP